MITLTKFNITPMSSLMGRTAMTDVGATEEEALAVDSIYLVFIYYVTTHSDTIPIDYTNKHILT